MIRDLDAALRRMFAGEAVPGSELANAPVSFAVPDQRWRGTGTGLALNAYLFRVGENRALRSNERFTRLDGGVMLVDGPPARVDCSYLITAWNKGQPISGADLEDQEHRLLSQALDVILRNPTLPRRHLTGLVAQHGDLPLMAAEPDGPGATGEFWSGLGTYLRPSITCRVTIALPDRPTDGGPPVSTVEVGTAEDPGRRYTVGGTVRPADPDAAPVAGAWLRVAGTARIAVTDAGGRFVLSGLTAGDHQIEVRAVGFHPASAPIVVPSPVAGTDIQLQPL
ncbi:Pvc16 family protein [Phytohabitans sp. LJ34]|uniref:Pvc16 family protein n=1 Tax=Phytohabitans sp. LJ34 TaxID=3452217 RepID=UPI003F88D244